jgi:uncharacterized protein YjbK
MAQEGKIGREIEIKLDLGSFTNYLKILGFLGQIEHEELQQNGFFDSEDRKLAKAGWALRVRAEKKRGLVTIKSIPVKPGLAVIRQEIEAEIPRRDALDILDGDTDVMSLHVMPIEYIRDKITKVKVGTLVKFDNLRQTKLFKIDDFSYMLEVDKTEFSDGSSDYELELELSDTSRIEAVEAALRRLFSQLNIPFVKQDESKFGRALKKAKIH